MKDESKAQTLACEDDIMLLQTSFEPLAGENSLGSGEVLYLKSTINHHRCDYIITNKRIMVWSRRNGAVKSVLFGVFAETGPAYLTRNITFQIPWGRLAEITKGRYGLARTLVFKTTDGQEFRIAYNSFGNEKAKLFAAIKTAIGSDL